MRLRRFPSSIIAVVVALAGTGRASADVKLTRSDDRVRVEVDGRLLTEYIFQGAYRPYCHPVLAADGTPLTRNFPMKEVAGEDHDHPHHRSLWFAHSDVNGVDFWNQDDAGSRRPKGRIVHEAIVETTDGEVGVLRTRNRWVAPTGNVFCTDDTTLRFGATGEDRTIDFEVTLRAPAAAPVQLNDNKDGVLALRLATWLNLPRTPATTRRYTGGVGELVTAKGDRNGAAWGKRAPWADVHGVHAGRTHGVAIFDHPRNLRHPTWWHARDYGLFAANPLGQHDFEPRTTPPNAGLHTIPAGGSLTLRYRVLLHSGDEKEAKLAEKYAAYAASAPAADQQGVTYRAPSGTTLRLMLDDANLGPEVSMGEITFPPHANSGEHAHGAIEIFYVVAGELEHVVNGTSTILRPGMAGYVKPPDKVIHKTGPAGAKAVVVWVPGAEAHAIVSRWKKEP